MFRFALLWLIGRSESWVSDSEVGSEWVGRDEVGLLAPRREVHSDEYSIHLGADESKL